MKSLVVGTVLLLLTTAFSAPAFAESGSELDVKAGITDLKQGLDTSRVWYG
jgi:hypothetical protein